MAEQDSSGVHPSQPDQSASAALASDSRWYDVDVPETYTDSVNVGVGPYGVTLTFGVRSGEALSPRYRVYMGQQLARVLERLMHRALVSFEIENEAAIVVAPRILDELQLTDVDISAIDAKRDERFGARE
ncbi:MAG: hypothetical protein ACKVVT_01190 [Dehalococcoidia bacterium]